MEEGTKHDWLGTGITAWMESEEGDRLLGDENYKRSCPKQGKGGWPHHRAQAASDREWGEL